MHQSYSCSFKNKIRVPHPQGENLNLRSATSKESSVDVIDVIDGDAGRAIDVDEDQFYKDLRGMQKETNCTEKVVLQFISKFEKYCKCPFKSSLSSHDKKMQVLASLHSKTKNLSPKACFWTKQRSHKSQANF